MPQKTCAVYILASKKYGTLYIGVTSDLVRRVYEHKQEMVDGFTKRYHIHDLVYFETSESIEGAIIREKQLKGTNRDRKINLIETMNPEWNDLYETILR
jgi:putative endonuclease